jgi:hypothetical protein
LIANVGVRKPRLRAAAWLLYSKGSMFSLFAIAAISWLYTYTFLINISYAVTRFKLSFALGGLVFVFALAERENEKR